MNVEEYRDHIWKLSNELSEYAELEGSEIGEACSLMISLVGYEGYISEDVVKALCKEMEWHINNFKNNCTIVEEEMPVRKYKVLEWNL